MLSFLSLILVLLSIFSVGKCETDNNQVVTVAYSFDIPYMEKLTIGDDVYDKVILPGVLSAADPGEPCLPIKGAYILLSKNTKVDEISVTSNNVVSLGSGFNVQPSAEPVPLYLASSAKPPEPNPEIYDSETPYPGTLFAEVGTHSFRGYNILILTLHPVQYVPVTGELLYYPKLTVSLKTVEDENTTRCFVGYQRIKLRF